MADVNIYEGINNLCDILDLPALIEPKMRHIQVSKGTRGPIKVETTLPIDQQLKSVVYIENLIEPSILKVIGRSKEISLGPTLSRLSCSTISALYDARFLSMYLSPVMNSEKDTQEWINKVLLNPAVATAHVFKRGSFPDGPNSTYAFNFVSPPVIRKQPIADSVLVNENQVQFLTVEVKTPNSFPSSTFESLRNCSDKFKYPVAVPFSWPTTADNVQRKDKATKLLVQVYSQMMHYNVQYAMLSSYNQTVFFYHDNTRRLYISKSYYIGSRRSLKAIVAWISASLALKDFEHDPVGHLDIDDSVHLMTPRGAAADHMPVTQLGMNIKNTTIYMHEVINHANPNIRRSLRNGVIVQVKNGQEWTSDTYEAASVDEDSSGLEGGNNVGTDEDVVEGFSSD